MKTRAVRILFAVLLAASLLVAGCASGTSGSDQTLLSGKTAGIPLQRPEK